jgi:hypothetical protein
VRRRLRTLAIAGLVGVGVGLVVGGMTGRIFMRLLFLMRRDTLGLETAMGAVIGEVTAGGTVFIAIFGAFFGLAVAVAYVCVRAHLPSGLWWREAVFVLGTSAAMLGLIVRLNRDDFYFLPITASLALILAAVALAAAPVPYLIERFAPDRPRRPGRLARGVVSAGLLATIGYAVTGIVGVYAL